MALFEAGHGRVFLYTPAHAHNTVQKAVRVVPGVAVAVQRRRRHGVVVIGDVPIGLTLVLTLHGRWRT